MSYWPEDKEHPTTDEMINFAEAVACPECQEHLVLRYRKADNQPFFSCSAYPDCKGSMNWQGVVGWTKAIWESPEEGDNKINPTRTEAFEKRRATPTNENTEYWRKKFLEEREFVMQQLHDIKNAYTLLESRTSKIEEHLKTKPILIDKDNNIVEEDIPF